MVKLQFWILSDSSIMAWNISSASAVTYFLSWWWAVVMWLAETADTDTRRLIPADMSQYCGCQNVSLYKSLYAYDDCHKCYSEEGTGQVIKSFSTHSMYQK